MRLVDDLGLNGTLVHLWIVIVNVVTQSLHILLSLALMLLVPEHVAYTLQVVR